MLMSRCVRSSGLFLLAAATFRPMSKYDALRQLLEPHTDRVTVTFEDLDKLLPGGLPVSAYTRDAWWGNEVDGRHVQARAWRAAGFRARPDRAAQLAHFDPI